MQLHRNSQRRFYGQDYIYFVVAKTFDNYPYFREPIFCELLMEELKIPKIDPDRFARVFNVDFIKEQSDEWIIKFYGFLLEEHESLWRKKSSFDKEGILRSKPIIRLNDGSHTKPFESDGEALAFLPSKYKKYFPTVKESIALDKKAREFLKNKLELIEPDMVDGIFKRILPQYKQNSINITEEKHLQHIATISDTLKSSVDEYRRKELLDKLRETSFLLAINPVNKKLFYKKPAEIYIDKIYSENQDIEIYFEGNNNVWFLDERYKDIIDLSILESIGCKTEIQVKCEKAGYDGNVTITNVHARHVRGLDGFDPDCEIEGLKYALENINIAKAKIIWTILKEHYKQISGVVESSKNQTFNDSKNEETFSKMGDLLTRYSWLKDNEGIFHKPSEIQLSELSEEFDKEITEAKYIADKLEFINLDSETDVEELYYNQLPPKSKEFIDLIKKLGERRLEEKAKEILEKLIEENPINDFSPESMREDFMDSLDSPKTSSNYSGPNNGWSGITLEEEEQIRRENGNDFLDRLKKMDLLAQPKLIKDYTIVDNGHNPREFLREQYGGHCQICNTRLDLGNNKRLSEKYSTFH